MAFLIITGVVFSLWSAWRAWCRRMDRLTQEADFPPESEWM